MGLNYHGITYISNENRLLFGKIFGALANLFSVAPETFKLRGEFYWEEGNTDTDKYEGVNMLKKMGKWGKDMEKNKDLYVVHMGI